MTMIRVAPEFDKKLKKLKFECEQEASRRISQEEFTKNIDIIVPKDLRFNQKRGKQWFY